MKKFLLFALCAISACSVFAEAFSKAKYDQFVKNNDVDNAYKYAYESQVSEEFNASHCMAAFYHYYNVITNKQPTVEGLNILADKYKQKIGTYHLNFIVIAILAGKQGLQQESLECAYKIPGNQEAHIQLVYNRLFQYAKYNNTSLIWKYGKNCLTLNGGIVNEKIAFDVLTTMFRYKKDTSKEQQIEFINQLSQMYPVPGTDFNKWKEFMGFLGYKYKALTKKDLF